MWADYSLLGSPGLGVSRGAVQLGWLLQGEQGQSEKGRVLMRGWGWARGIPKEGVDVQDGKGRWSFIHPLYHLLTALEPTTAYENGTSTTPHPDFSGALVSWGIYKAGGQQGCYSGTHM